MKLYGHDLVFGTFITPRNQPPQHAVTLAQLSERVGLEMVTFQDHPYQPAFHDTWTLLSYVAARTERVRLAPNVLNLPLRPPAMVARSAASLDLLSGGRLELGLGAGAFWEGIVAMGQPRLSPGEAVDALEEAIAIIRQIWDTSQRGGVRFEGEQYTIAGAKRGPEPAHDIGLWIGAYGPRMLRLTGRLGDGWVPSLGYLKKGPASLRAMNAHIDEGAEAAGRAPQAIRRMLNINGKFAAQNEGLLQGPPQQWAEELAEIALTYGTSAFILAADDAATIERFAGEVVPATRERVAAG